jgi:hypothetical protein
MPLSTGAEVVLVESSAASVEVVLVESLVPPAMVTESTGAISTASVIAANCCPGLTPFDDQSITVDAVCVSAPSSSLCSAPGHTKLPAGRHTPIVASNSVFSTHV